MFKALYYKFEGLHLKHEETCITFSQKSIYYFVNWFSKTSYHLNECASIETLKFYVFFAQNTLNLAKKTSLILQELFFPIEMNENLVLLMFYSISFSFEKLWTGAILLLL